MDIEGNHYVMIPQQIEVKTQKEEVLYCCYKAYVIRQRRASLHVPRLRLPTPSPETKQVINESLHKEGQSQMRPYFLQIEVPMLIHIDVLCLDRTGVVMFIIQGKKSVYFCNQDAWKAIFTCSISC